MGISRENQSCTSDAHRRTDTFTGGNQANWAWTHLNLAGLSTPAMMCAVQCSTDLLMGEVGIRDGSAMLDVAFGLGDRIV